MVVPQIVATALVGMAVSAAPAAAAPDSLAGACQATRDALAAGGTVTGSSGTATFAGQRFANQWAVVDPAGTYGLISGARLRPKQRAAALQYLKAPAATAWFAAGRFGSEPALDSTYAQAREQSIGLPADCDAAAGDASITLDDAGRLVSWISTGVSLSFTYGPQSIATPRSVPYAKWLRASQAASLDSTLRDLARTAALGASPDPQVIAAKLRTMTGVARAVPLKVRTLRAGGLLYARNPYTGTYHAWRVYVKDGTVRAKRVAP